MNICLDNDTLNMDFRIHVQLVINVQTGCESEFQNRY